MPTRPTVVVTRKLPDPIETRMMELFDCRLNVDDQPMTQAELVAAVKSADVLVPTVTDRIDAGVLTPGRRRGCKLIASFGTGVDHIDLATARQRGITVTNTPGVLTEDTADMTMALILAVPRRLAEGERLMRSGELDRLEPDLDARPPHLAASGSASSAWAASARRWRGARAASGSPIHYHNRRRVHARGRGRARGDLLGEPRPDAGAHGHRLDQLPAHAGDLSPDVGAPAQADEAVRLSRQHRARRGDRRERADPHAGRAARSRGAGLDVFEHEPAVNPKLLKLDNVVLLPHMGSATIEGRIDMGEKVIINIKTFADGHKPPDRVLETMF